MRGRSRRALPAMPVIGFLRSTSPDGTEHLLAAFRQGLKETDEYSDIDALDLCQKLRLSVEKTEAKERRFSRWGVAALPLSVFVGVVLGATVGATVANIGIGVAIGAGFGVGVGVAVTVAVFVFRSSE